MKSLKHGKVDLNQARSYWMHFERDKEVQKAREYAAHEDGIRFACNMLIDDLKQDSQHLNWCKEKAGLFMKYFCENAPDAAQEYFDREAPKSLDKYLNNLRENYEVVKEPKKKFKVKGSVMF